MFKIFGIGEDEKMQTKELNVNIKQDEEKKSEKGQIAVDIVENETQVLIVAPIAGVDINEIDISVDDFVLTLSGNRTKPENIYTPDCTIRNSECFWGEFSRNIILPENLDLDSIRATMENNLLVLNIPKIKFTNGNNITINKLD